MVHPGTATAGVAASRPRHCLVRLLVQPNLQRDFDSTKGLIGRRIDEIGAQRESRWVLLGPWKIDETCDSSSIRHHAFPDGPTEHLSGGQAFSPLHASG